MSSDLSNLLSISDWVLFGLGAALVVVCLLYWLLRVRRDPLADVPGRPNQVVPEVALLPVLVWLICGSALSMLSEGSGEGDVPAARMIWAGNVAQLFGGLACFWVGARFFHGGLERFLFGDKRIARHAVAGVAYLLAALALCPLVMEVMGVLLSRLAPQYNYYEHEVIDALRRGQVPIVAIWIGTVLVAPVAEECFFRGVVQTCLENLIRSRWLCVVSTAAIFGAVHAGAG
ncbi:MAG: CPBP family intramembrane glutamic endopeptidase, partial [Phycisphaerae bacterium]